METNNLEKENDSLVREKQSILEEPTATDGTGNVKTKISKKNKIRISIVILAIIVLGAFAYFYKGLFIAATVNGSPISRLAVIAELEKNTGKTTLDALITEKLINDEADKNGKSAGDDAVMAEIKKLEDQLKLQNLTLDQAMSQQGITIEELKKQVRLHLELEGLLGDTLKVSDAEIEQYIKDNQITIPDGQEATFKEQVKNQLEQQKFSEAAGSYVESLKSGAKINYYVNY